MKTRSGSGLQGEENWTYTYYVRDAQGNLLATYERDFTTPGATYSDQMYLKEQQLYGSSRTGVRNVSVLLSERSFTFTGNYSGTGVLRRNSPGAITSYTVSAVAFTHELGRKSYEESNHLGNVLVAVSDARKAVNSGSAIISFDAKLNMASDYTAFGAEMPGRNYTTSAYRFGFNGKENDRETVGTGQGTQDCLQPDCRRSYRTKRCSCSI